MLSAAAAIIAVSCTDAHVSLVWGDTSDRYPQDAVDEIVEKTPFAYPVWKGEKACAQAFLTADADLEGIGIRVTDMRCGSHMIPAEAAQASFVGYVMADVLDPENYAQCGFREPGQYDSLMVADIIDIAETKDVPAGTVQPIWVSVRVPADAVPGKYSGRVIVSGKNFARCSVPFELEVADRVLPEPSDWKFHLDLWQNP